MTSPVLQRLLREWAALVAILAMVLGPLAIATSRGLTAQERVAIAAGLAQLPICAPGDHLDGLTGKPTSADCHDHCLPSGGAIPAFFLPGLGSANFAERLQPLPDRHMGLLSRLSLPPATGPPVS